MCILETQITNVSTARNVGRHAGIRRHNKIITGVLALSMFEYFFIMSREVRVKNQAIQHMEYFLIQLNADYSL